MKILFLVPYPLRESPSQRFRFEQYLDILRAHGHTLEVHSFLDLSGWKVAFRKGNAIAKLWAIKKGAVRRTLLLFRMPSFEMVFIHREAAPFGPPVLEWIIARIFRKKIVFDFDDAIWLSDRPEEPWWFAWIKWRGKVKHICRWSYKISCGNEYLCSYARRYNPNAHYNPTTIDTMNLHDPDRFERKTRETVTIGWTGSHSTLRFLNHLEMVLRKLEEKLLQVTILVIANEQPKLSLKSLKFIPWSRETEVDDLRKIDIGLMPLPDEEWSKGKCGFKALQYMSLGIPALVSPVGVNTTIVDDGHSGYYCTTETEWLERLEYLVTEKDVREQMGKRGREKVIRLYSVASNSSNFLSLFE